MDRLGPFEPSPHLAVAVSGGGDSMALMWLAVDWVTSKGGSVTALTVDHKLRLGSTQEAAQVAQWCAALGCLHETLTWAHDVPPSSALQERARAARYELLEHAAARQGILHLLTAHHADDQAETIAMRRDHGSGIEGLAGMPAMLALRHVRVLRPLLTVPGARLKATCRTREQAWIEDPSNDATRFERVRMRRTLSEQGSLPTGSAAGERVRREVARADVMARHVTLYPTGHAVIDPAGLTGRFDASALGEVLRTVGDAEHSPDRGSLERLAELIVQPDFAGATLGGCRLRLWRDRLLATAENRGGYPAQVELSAGGTAIWGAFTILAAQACRVEAVHSNWPADCRKPCPADIVRSQPGLYDADGLAAAPSLYYWRPGIDPREFNARFTPRRNLADGIFPIVS